MSHDSYSRSSQVNTISYRKRKTISKKECQMKHFIKRFELRVRKPWSKVYREIIKTTVQDGRNFIFRDSYRISHHMITLENRDWVVVYDSFRSTLVTIMMYNDEYRKKRNLKIQQSVCEYVGYSV